MNRLGRLVTILLTMLITAVAVIRLSIGRTHTANPLLAVIFTNPDGSPCQEPCLFGLKPGHMTYEQELSALGRSTITQYLARSEKSLPDLHLYANNDFTVSISPQEAWSGINYSNLRPNAPASALNTLWSSLTLGETIAEFGSPDYVATSRIVAGVYYVKQHMVFTTLNRAAWGFGPDDFVFGIGRIADDELFQRASNMLPWKGFDVYGTRYNRPTP